jgi:hypothetical protein
VADIVNRLIAAVGPNPRAWIVCGPVKTATRVAAVAVSANGLELLFWRAGDIARLTLGEDGLWRRGPSLGIRQVAPDIRPVVERVPPRLEPVPKTHIDCPVHGQHPIDGARLAQHARASARLHVSELEPL